MPPRWRTAACWSWDAPAAAFERIDRLATSVVDLEQYVDFLSNRTFHQTLLCPREIELTPLIRPEQLNAFYLGS